MYIHVCMVIAAGDSPSKRMMSSTVATTSSPMATAVGGSCSADGSDSTDAPPTSPDNLFSQFRHICQQLEMEPSYNSKTKIVADFIKNGSSEGKTFVSIQGCTCIYMKKMCIAH